MVKKYIFIALAIIIGCFIISYLVFQLGVKPSQDYSEIISNDQEPSENGAFFMFSGEPDVYNDPHNPFQSPPVDNISEMAEEFDVSVEGIIQVGIKDREFHPESFEVNSGEKIVLAVSSLDEWVHVFKFKDESLHDVALGLSSGQTRMITFFAPETPGTYEFFCDVPGHENLGEKGVMIVK